MGLSGGDGVSLVGPWKASMGSGSVGSAKSEIMASISERPKRLELEAMLVSMPLRRERFFSSRALPMLAATTSLASLSRILRLASIKSCSSSCRSRRPRRA